MRSKAATKSRRTQAKANRTVRSSRKTSRKSASTNTASPAPKRILAPIDFSEFSDRALRYALSFAQWFNAELVLVHVVQAFPIDFLMGIKSVKQANEWQLQQARTHLRKLSLELTADGRISAESVVKFGKPFNEIVEVAKDRGIDLIIIGTHGYTGLKHIQLGSTAEMVVRYAPCPVLVLPNRGANEDAVKEK
jgi:universal stress protein A